MLSLSTGITLGLHVVLVNRYRSLGQDVDYNTPLYLIPGIG